MLNNAYGPIKLHRVLRYFSDTVSFRLAGNNLMMNRENWTTTDEKARATAVLNGRRSAGCGLITKSGRLGVTKIVV